MKPKYIQALHPHHNFIITFELEDNDPKLKTMIDQLAAYGFRPTLTGDTWPRTPDGTPICPKHNTEMPQREKQGDKWHSHSIINPETGEITYCRGYESNSGPGYEIVPQPTTTNGRSQPQPTTTNSRSQPQPTTTNGRSQPQPTTTNSRSQPQPTTTNSRSQPQPTTNGRSQPQTTTNGHSPQDPNLDPTIIAINDQLFGE